MVAVEVVLREGMLVQHIESTARKLLGMPRKPQQHNKPTHPVSTTMHMQIRGRRDSGNEPEQNIRGIKTEDEGGEAEILDAGGDEEEEGEHGEDDDEHVVVDDGGGAGVRQRDDVADHAHYQDCPEELAEYALVDLAMEEEHVERGDALAHWLGWCAWHVPVGP